MFSYDEQLNGFAASSSADDMVGLTAGCAIVLSNYFVQASHFIDLNAPYRLDSAAATPDIFASLADLKDTLIRRASPPEGTSAREEFASRARNSALSWILLHELGHIANGHTDYARSAFGLDELDEISPRKHLPLNVRQTLEFDADAFASKHVYEGCLRITSGTGVQAEEHDYLQWIYDATFGIYSLFLLFGAERSFSGSVEDWSHPHPPASVRQAWSVNFPASLLAVRDPDFDVKRLYPALGGAAYDAERVFSHMTGSNIPTYDAGQVAVQSSFIELYAREWRTLRGKLEPFVRGGTLAPAMNPVS